MISIFFTGCSSQRQMLSDIAGFTFPAGTEITYKDTHGGFHGDGATYAQIILPDTFQERRKLYLQKTKVGIHSRFQKTYRLPFMGLKRARLSLRSMKEFRLLRIFRPDSGDWSTGTVRVPTPVTIRSSIAVAPIISPLCFMTVQKTLSIFICWILRV